jgi:penicillin-binding protein 2
MLPSAGYGADAAAPAVKEIWDDLYGLQGAKAALPGGNLPATPTITKANG